MTTKYETLQDIEQSERERRARAIRRDQLLEMFNTNARKAERLSAPPTAQKYVNALHRVIEAANTLPDSVAHEGIALLGTAHLPGGVTKFFLVTIANSALRSLNAQLEQRKNELDAATKARDNAKAALDEEFPE